MNIKYLTRNAVLVLVVAVSGNAFELPAFFKTDSEHNTLLYHSGQSIRSSRMMAADEIMTVEKEKQEERRLSTEGPTESPAPSPSPSWNPTAAPTSTAKPTAEPTEGPTESPAPSPSPSANPTMQPSDAPSVAPSAGPTITPGPTYLPSYSPSGMPSVPPSAIPSTFPTISPAPSSFPSSAPSSEPSAAPSSAPSDTPSSTPSTPPTSAPSSAPSDTPSASPSSTPTAAPTKSMKPSAAPSDTPTASPAPSQQPSQITVYAADFGVTLPLTQVLNDTQIEAFESATAAYLEGSEVEEGTVSGVVVEVLSQFLVEAAGGRRSLQEAELSVDFTVVALYTGTSSGFDLIKEIDPIFQEQNQLWVRALSDTDPVFEDLIQPLFPGIEGSTSSGGGGMSTTALVFVLLVAVTATIVGLAASIYSIRTYNRANYGEHLGSVHSEDEEDMRSMDRSRVSLPAPTPDSKSMVSTANQSAQECFEYVLNAASDINCDSVVVPLPENLMYHQPASSYQAEPLPFIRSNVESQSRQDPPSAASLINFQTKRPAEPTAEPSDSHNVGQMRQQASLIDHSETPSEVSLPHSTASTGISGFARHNIAMQAKKQAFAPGRVQREPSEIGNEIHLTQSEGGTLGAAAITGSATGALGSEFSSQANSFFTKMLGGAKKSAPSETGSLGARAKAPVEQLQLEEKSSYDSTRRAGLYDVFAPAGPIGIVVDTTREGPAVHSLKPTSPMLGLINPGDLIVGLDDQDTRGMTAATLTRLMAKKANQKERKITLLTLEDY